MELKTNQILPKKLRLALLFETSALQDCSSDNPLLFLQPHIMLIPLRYQANMVLKVITSDPLLLRLAFVFLPAWAFHVYIFSQNTESQMEQQTHHHLQQQTKVAILYTQVGDSTSFQTQNQTAHKTQLLDIPSWQLLGQDYLPQKTKTGQPPKSQSFL